MRPNTTILVVTAVSSLATGCLFAGTGPDPMRARANAMHADIENREVQVTPPPPVSFPEGEAALDEASRNWGATNGTPVTIARAYMVEAGWGVEGRERRAAVLVYYKGGPEAHCYQRRAFLKELLLDSGRWAAPSLDVEATYVRVNCQQVDGLRGSPP